MGPFSFRPAALTDITRSLLHVCALAPPAPSQLLHIVFYAFSTHLKQAVARQCTQLAPSRVFSSSFFFSCKQTVGLGSSVEVKLDSSSLYVGPLHKLLPYQVTLVPSTPSCESKPPVPFVPFQSLPQIFSIPLHSLSPCIGHPASILHVSTIQACVSVAVSQSHAVFWLFRHSGLSSQEEAASTVIDLASALRRVAAFLSKSLCAPRLVLLLYFILPSVLK